MIAGVGGTASLILNGAAFEEPPPEAPTGGVKTVTFAVPATAMSEGVIIAVNCLDEIKVVGRSVPFHRTMELLTKFVPVTVRVKPGPPAVAEFGLIVMIVGVAGACGVIVNGAAFDEPPPLVPIGGLNTVTLADPAAAISEAGIVAVNCVPETKTVGRSTPFHCTTELKMKLEPFISLPIYAGRNFSRSVRSAMFIGVRRINLPDSVRSGMRAWPHASPDESRKHYSLHDMSLSGRLTL